MESGPENAQSSVHSSVLVLWTLHVIAGKDYLSFQESLIICFDDIIDVSTMRLNLAVVSHQYNPFVLLRKERHPRIMNALLMLDWTSASPLIIGPRPVATAKTSLQSFIYCVNYYVENFKKQEFSPHYCLAHGRPDELPIEENRLPDVRSQHTCLSSAIHLSCRK
jgi:hypothetical protein